MLPRNISCDRLVKKMSTFCHCSKSLPEAKVKKFGLILLAEEISNSLVKTLSLCGYYCLLFYRFIMKRSKLSKKKYKIYIKKWNGANILCLRR